MTIKDHIDNLIASNAKHIAELSTEQEVKEWLSSLLWSVVGFINNYGGTQSKNDTQG